MANSKIRFQKAIRESVDQLIASGENKLTKAKIIENALYDDGKPVGKTTLYAKNKITNDLIHADLIKEIDTKIEELSRTSNNKRKTLSDTKKNLKQQIDSLNEKNKILIRQLVEIEDSFEINSHRNDENLIQNLEVKLYIISYVLNFQLVGSSHKDLDKIIKAFEAKYHGTQIKTIAKEKILKMRNEIEPSKVISMK